MITYTPIDTRRNAHQDDIHGLVLLPGNQILGSGSKDGSTKFWNFPSLTPYSSSCEEVASKIDYQRWVTAITAGSKDSFFIGTRDGRVEKHNLSGRKESVFSHTATEEVEGCKERNQSRIHCLTRNDASLFVGVTSGFFECDLSGKTEPSFCRTSDRDWVYCVHPLASDKILAVTGPELEIFQRTADSQWGKQGVIQTQSQTKIQRHRLESFISSITPLAETNNQFFATANFDGSVRLHDIARRSEIRRYAEHTRRVWQVVNTFDANVIASCADDATIKIWDIRQRQNSLTIQGFPGRVSALVSSGNLIACGSCPDRPKEAEYKAMISVFDLRWNLQPIPVNQVRGS